VSLAFLLDEHYPPRLRDLLELRGVGDPITGIEAADAIPGAYVLQAGTRRDLSGQLVSAGGRVLSVVGTGPNLAAARDRAYAGISSIQLDGAHFRTDIALRAALA
jgi:phosphoribosylamine--glycine ligase